MKLKSRCDVRLMCVWLMAVVSAWADLRVDECTASRIVCTWELGTWKTIVGEVRGENRIEIEADAANMELGENGEPILPARSFYVGIPPQGRARVTVTPLEVGSERLAFPLIKRDTSAGGVVGRPWLRFRDTWVSEGKPRDLGRLKTVFFVLRPFLYDESTRELRVLRRARVEVSIDQGPAVPTSRLGRSHFDGVYRTVLLNYEVARGWALPPVSPSARKAAAVFPLSADRRMGRFRVGDGTGNGPGGISESTTDENGLIRIPGTVVNAVLGSGTAMAEVALYASAKIDLPLALPDTARLSPAFVKIPLLKIDMDGDGRVDDEDWFVTYVTGGSDWYYDSIVRDFRYRLDRYDDYRTYWLVTEPSAGAMSRYILPSESPLRSITHFRNRLLLKRSRLVPANGGPETLDFVWERFTRGVPPIVLWLPVADICTDSAGSIRVMRGTSTGGGGLSLSLGGRVVCNTCPHEVWQPITYWGDGKLEVAFSAGTTADASAELERLELRYMQELRLPPSGRLTVFGESGSGLVQYRVRDLPSGQLVYIIRIPPDERRMSLVDTVRTGGDYAWIDTAGLGVRYHIAVAQAFQPLPSVEPYRSSNTEFYGIVNLHEGRPCDYLIIYHRDFAVQASRLAQHKRALGHFPYASVVEIGDIYREFSAGKVDPMAIRHFLTYARRYWPQEPPLTYVVLMGLGHFDFRGVMSREPIFIPVWEGRNSPKPVCAEDSLGGDSLALILGRIPCRTVAQAKAYVDKVIETEDPLSADWGPWRNRLILVADNDRQGGVPDNLGHHLGTEAIAQTVLERWPAVELHKVYLFEYRFSEQGVMTEAADALVGRINAGAGSVCYYGHGGDYVWADERVFANEDIPRLVNRGRYPLVSSFSCRVGAFDRPDHDCMSDLLVNAPSSGAIASVAATREAYDSNNKPFGRSMYAALYDSLGGISMGQAYVIGRLQNYSMRLEQYAYLGDPSICLMAPRHVVSVGIYEKADNGRHLDTLKALQQVVVRGEVRRRGEGVADAQYGTSERPAFVQIGLYNPDRPGERRDGITVPVSYIMPGTPVFALRVPIQGGRFEQAILIPRNVVLDKPGVRLTAYAWRDTSPALGCDTSLLFHGTDTSGAALSDTVGPLIAVRPLSARGGSAAASTDKIRSPIPLRCEIVLKDPSGLDVIGTGPDEGLTVEVPGVLSRRSLNQAFQFRDGSYQEGSAPFALTDEQVRPGRYRLNISARDLLANISFLSVELEVLDSSAITLDHAVNFPNPMRMGEGTRFYYSAIAGDKSDARPDVELKIYTMSGKLLRVVRQLPNGWLWDGTDQFGNRLGPNVYLWRMSIAGAGPNGEDLKSPLRKLVIHPPR